MKRATERQKEYMREWYKDNKESHIAKVKAYQKENNYRCEKTEEQRKIRSIKRRTRAFIPN